MLQTGDRDRYLTSLFAPPEVRPALHALYAFNLELARVAEVVSEPMIGEIRLAWWRETLDGVYAGAPRRHDVAEGLAQVLEDHEIDRVLLNRMIDARAHDLEEAPFATLDGLKGYLSATSSGLVAAAARLLGGKGADALAAPAGVAIGLVGLVRSVGFHGRQGRVMMPRDLMMSRNLGRDLDPHDLLHDLLQGRMSPALGAVVAALLDEAEGEIAAFDEESRTLSRAAVPAYLPLTLARSDLKALRRAHGNPFALEGRPRPGRIGRLIVGGLWGQP